MRPEDLAGSSGSAADGASVLAGPPLGLSSGTGSEDGVSGGFEVSSGVVAVCLGGRSLAVEGSGRRMSSLVTSLSSKMRSRSTPIERELVQ